jgi:O-antigen/teichoic acid export membrane protein
MAVADNNSMHRRFATGAAWSLLGSGVSQGVSLVGLVFVARSMDREQYGQFIVLQNTVLTLGVLAGFGVGITATRFVAAWKEGNKSRLESMLGLCETSVALLGLATGLFVSMASGLIAGRGFNSPELALPLSIASASLLFATLDGFQKSALIGFGDMRAFASCSILGSIMGSVSLFVGVQFAGLSGAAFGILVGAVLQATVSRLLYRRVARSNSVRPAIAGCLAERHELFAFALPAFLAGVLVAPTHWIAQVALANTAGGYAEVALLGIAMQWHAAVLFFPAVIGRVALPMMTEYVGQAKDGDARALLLFAIKINAAICLPLAALIALASPWIISLYGVAYQDGAATLMLCVFAATLSAIASPAGGVLAARSRMWLGFLMNLAWAIVFLSIALAMIGIGALGVALGLLLAYCAHSCWVWYWAWLQLRAG